MDDNPVVFLDASRFDRSRIDGFFADELRANEIKVTFDPEFRESCDAYLLVLSSLHPEPDHPRLVEAYQGRDEVPEFIPIRLDTAGATGKDYLADSFEINEFTDFSQFAPKLITRLKRRKALDHLVEVYRKGDLILFLGAGVSARSGFPVWGELTDSLLNWAAAENLIEKSFKNSLEASQKQGDYDDVAEAIFTAPGVTHERLLLPLRQQLHNEGKLPSPELMSLLSLEKLAGVLTTNFDDLIEKGLPGQTSLSIEDGEELLKCLSKRRFVFGKLYGDLEQGLLLLSPNEFRDKVSKQPAFLDFMHSLFVSRTLLFLGCSLKGIENYLDALPFHEEALRKHYALVAVDGDGWKTQAALLQRRYNVEVIPYPRDKNHQGFPAFTEPLSSRLKKVDEESFHSEPARSRFRGIKRIFLENIGPHERLELNLDPHWNVLLGDNGIGKTHILKAIALAACGRKGADHARSLIRGDQNTARVQIHTQDSQFEMLLTRNKDRIEVKVLPGSILEIDGFFILAFPPLRTASRPISDAGNGNPMKRPVAEDVLPILIGDLDPRMERLKSWLIQLDHIISKKTNDDPTAKNYRRLRESFFEILSDLTEGVTFKFGRVDAHAKQVYVHTDDGEIPIEGISQGMTSLLGWIGVLLHRLYEIYEEDNPLERFGLVLIDEIDAHMHPEWQQVLVPKLKIFFPDIQFIATTHSPLIVGDMPGSQVQRLARNQTGKVIRIEVLDEMTRGRADQILTGRLFGLKTTLGHETRQKIQEYTDLAAERRDPLQEERYQSLRAELAARIPLPDETAPERKAQALLRAIMEEQISDEHPSVKTRVMDRARALFEELKESAP